MAKEKFPQPFGKYILLEKIALGGMAELFRAKTIGAEGFEREVVIKRILPHFTEDENFTRMFIDEARIAAKLHHANVVQIFDFDKVDDTYYIAMEFVEGRDVKKIRERLKKEDIRVGVWQAVFVIIEVAKALQYAHTRTHKGNPLNIIHRDVSPQNILVSYAGEVKLMDFGIAKAQERSTKTRAGTVKGKCAYMSPEQARGKPLDKRSDLFGLAIILWELLTGKRLFAGETDFETLSNVLKCEVTRPSEHNSDIPRDLDEIVLKALAKEADDRYDDCGSFQKELSRLFYSSVEDMETVSLSGMMETYFRGEIDALNELDAGKTMMLQDMIAKQRESLVGMPAVPPKDPSISTTGPLQPPPFNLGDAADGGEATMALPAFSESTNTDEIDDEDLKSTMPLSDLQAQALEKLKLNANAAAQNQVTGTFRGPPAFGPNSGSYTGLHARKKISPLAAVMLTLGAIGTAFAVVLVVMNANTNEGPPKRDVIISLGAQISFISEPAGLGAKFMVDGTAIVGDSVDCEIGNRIKVQAQTGDRESRVVDHICVEDTTLTLTLKEAGPKQIQIQIVAQGATIRINGEEKGRELVTYTGDENAELVIEADYGNGQVEKKNFTLDGKAGVVTLTQSIQQANLVVKVTPNTAVVDVNGTRYLPVQGVARIPDQRFGRDITLKVTRRGCKEVKKTFVMAADAANQVIKLECNVTPPATGRVTIRSRPWAFVYQNGRHIGETPIRGRSFRPGNYTFVLKTNTGREKTIRVTIPAGKHAKPAIVDMSQP